MTREDLMTQRLTVLSADAAGFSRLMCRDEFKTVITLDAYRRIMSQWIGRYRGCVVDAVGDNLLARFNHTVDAVASAVAIQDELQLKNMQLPEGKRMHFRIGINCTDVIESNGRIYGTGVNIAARLESVAEPGGINISKSVFDSIQGRVGVQCKYMGLYSVKNICKQVDVYRIIRNRNMPGKNLADRLILSGIDTIRIED